MAAYLEKLVQPERRDRDALKGGLKELRFLFGGNVNAVTGAAATLVVLSRNAARLPPRPRSPRRRYGVEIPINIPFVVIRAGSTARCNGRQIRRAARTP